MRTINLKHIVTVARAASTIRFTKVLNFTLACSVAALTGCRQEKPQASMAEPESTTNSVSMQPNAPQLTNVTVLQAGTQKSGSVEVSGRLVWDEDATVRVFTPFAGIVRKMDVQVNDVAKKGQPLAEIQSADFEQALADGRKAASDFRKAERNLARAKDLAEHNAAPRKDLESAEADFASAEVEKNRTETRLAIYGATTTATNQGFLLPSPLDGMVVEKNITPGQEVRPDQMLANLPQYTAPLFTITDPSKLWIQIDVTEAELGCVQPGREFTFVSRALPDRVFTGKVDNVSTFIDPNSRTIKVRGSVDNSRRLLKAEMFVTVTLQEEERGTVASVPSKAVYLRGEKHYVFVETAPGQFVRREVASGSEDDGQVPIFAGVQPGEKVVSEGCLILQQLLK
jgi:cobalt-zinc-cadmium efflux system membrane fusion protein